MCRWATPHSYKLFTMQRMATSAVGCRGILERLKWLPKSCADRYQGQDDPANNGAVSELPFSQK